MEPSDRDRRDPLEEILASYGFDHWATRMGGRRLRCPHGLLISLTGECPVGCVSPLVILGLVELESVPAPHA